MYATIGNNIETGELITIGDIERCGGLYVLGKPRTGKSYLLIWLALQDIDHEHGLLFIDPHSDAIEMIIARMPERRKLDVILLDPTNKTHSFGVNLLRCADSTNPLELDRSYGRVRDIFVKVWGDEDGNLSVWLEKILRNSIYLLLENPGYTLVEIPLLLSEDTRFRNYLLQNVKVNPYVKDFWYNEFDRLSKRDRTEQVGPALTRLDIFRTNTTIRHIVGQKTTTIDFYEILNSGNAHKIVLLRMPTSLSDDVKQLIGMMLISQMLSAAFDRDQLPEEDRQIFGVYCDEFQNFATPDFAKLFTQTGKFKIMPTVAHQERLGQFKPLDPNRGATLASPSKVLFSLSVHDSQELAPEFAKAPPPPTEKRWEAEVVISQEPYWDMLRRGHANPRLHEIFTEYFRPLYYNLDRLKEEIENERLVRMDLLDETGMYQSEASLSQVDERREGRAASMARGRDITVSNKALIQTEHALERAMSTRGLAKEQSAKLVALYNHFKHYRQAIHNTDRFLIALMEGRIKPIPGQEQFAQFFIDIIGTCIHLIDGEVIRLYIHLSYGNPRLPRSIPAILAAKYWRQELEEAYMEERIKYYKQWRISTLTQPREWWDKKPDEQYFIETTARSLREDREEFRKREIKYDYYRLPYIEVKQVHDSFDRDLPDLPSRIFRADEINSIKDICRNYFLEKNVQFLIKGIPILKLIDDLIEFCTLLTKPENHIRVASGQYVERKEPTRTFADMNNEMAQELTNLPERTAYAKVVREQNGKRVVVKRKMETLPLPKPSWQGENLNDVKNFIELNTMRSGYVKPREQIEEEIRQRQDKWRGSGSDEAPPTHY